MSYVVWLPTELRNVVYVLSYVVWCTFFIYIVEGFPKPRVDITHEHARQ